MFKADDFEWLEWGEPMEFIGQMTVQAGTNKSWVQPLAGHLDGIINLDRLIHLTNPQEVNIFFRALIRCAYVTINENSAVSMNNFCTLFLAVLFFESSLISQVVQTYFLQ